MHEIYRNNKKKWAKLMTYKGVNGAKYTVIEPPLGKGGEGTVYTIAGMPGHVLKLFKPEKRTDTRHRKLSAMIATPLSSTAMQQVTWPTDIVFEGKKFVGYVMPFIKRHEPLNVAYSSKYKSTLSEKITIAKNLCAAVNAIHNAGQVCGDLNPNNIQVDPADATVTLVDADSYHIKEKNGLRIYRCEVGLPEYLAREVQEKMTSGQMLATAPLPTFTQQTDLFAVAVHMFALLMNGCHPFACAVGSNINISRLSSVKQSVTAPQPIDNIKNGFFPFHQKKANITTPAYAPDFDYLPSDIKNLFIRAFVNGHSMPTSRPNCVEWYNALDAMQKSLKTCATDNSHMYPSNLLSCPFCTAKSTYKAAAATYKPRKTRRSSAAASNTSGYRGGNTTGSSYRNTTTSRATSTTTRSSSYSSSRPTGLFSTALMFWLVTGVLSFFIQYYFHFYAEWGENLVAWGFGDGELEGWKNFLRNFAANIGVWGYIVIGSICQFIYNCYAHSEDEYWGFEIHHYLLSILALVVGSALWLALVYIISIGVQLILAAIIIWLVCGFCSGS